MPQKQNRNKKKPAPAPVVRLNTGQRVQEISRLLNAVEANVGAYRKAYLGDDIAVVPFSTDSTASIEATVINVQTRLESLARETRRINLRLGQ